MNTTNLFEYQTSSEFERSRSLDLGRSTCFQYVVIWILYSCLNTKLQCVQPDGLEHREYPDRPHLDFRPLFLSEIQILEGKIQSGFWRFPDLGRPDFGISLYSYVLGIL